MSIGLTGMYKRSFHRTLCSFMKRTTSPCLLFQCGIWWLIGHLYWYCDLISTGESYLLKVFGCVRPYIFIMVPAGLWDTQVFVSSDWTIPLLGNSITSVVSPFQCFATIQPIWTTSPWLILVKWINESMSHSFAKVDIIHIQEVTDGHCYCRDLGCSRDRGHVIIHFT